MAANEKSEDYGAQEPGRNFNLVQEPFIEILVPDPATLPDVILLAGFVGKSNRAGYFRLYLTPQLNEHLEILQTDVVHRQTIPAASDPIGGSLIWVKREAQLTHTKVATQQVQAQFLQGSITTQFLPKAGIESQGREYCAPSGKFCISWPLFDINSLIFISCPWG